MPSLAGSKRLAETPIASPSKAAATAKRSRLQYDYYDDEDDAGSSQEEEEEEWDYNDLDSSSDMSLDCEDEDLCIERFAIQPRRLSTPFDSSEDDDDDDVDPWEHITHEARRHRNEQAFRINRDTQPPSLPTTTHCRCGPTHPERKDCTNCTCSKQDHICQPATCGCHGTSTTCHNPFNKIDTAAIFGPEPLVLPHACFMSWALKQERSPAEQLATTTTRRSLFDLALQDAGSIEEFHDDWDAEPYLAWRARWDALPEDEQDAPCGVALQQELNRLAFAAQRTPGTSLFYSFCTRVRWASRDFTWHCRACGECRDQRQWHCENCNQCAYGRTLPCQTCAASRPDHRVL
ncbi:hypothetical protein M406DRAFT_74530 [Cryphonectria parasitica EP155]|uniref:Uncharacterized protein n=1 Tax=Cryphonectria parasitica (strain ATCC 38755 / EP155) TaxID=660469 RepID=A0A9P4XV73_CRYP1|nr:uncharacterized protein M406DRAFT_74530 [Cryphonectria parasitica EP155]KAF3761579.1 hypothetical protein M406DRAFT_74530 [Cryphonectria parasitica EP155]